MYDPEACLIVRLVGEIAPDVLVVVDRLLVRPELLDQLGLHQLGHVPHQGPSVSVKDLRISFDTFMVFHGKVCISVRINFNLI